VVRLEFPPALAGEILAEHPGTAVDVACCLYHRRYGPSAATGEQRPEA
jgi:hypothetical protein